MLSPIRFFRLLFFFKREHLLLTHCVLVKREKRKIKFISLLDYISTKVNSFNWPSNSVDFEIGVADFGRLKIEIGIFDSCR